jgi:hypothetical protein
MTAPTPLSPITPPPELVQEWLTEGHHQDYCSAYEHAIAKAAQWGADQELEACCEYMLNAPYGMNLNTNSNQLRAARRPRPPSLKKQALGLIDSNSPYLDDAAMSIIRRALEQLDD